MRTILILLLSALIGRSCDSGVETVTDQGKMVTSFALADTNGLTQSTFRFGDKFDFKFSITNLTKSEQVYALTGPSVVFEILSGDSILATSVDGEAWILSVDHRSIPSGGSEQVTWRGPKPRGGNPYFVLNPGGYIARVNLRYGFTNVKAPIPPVIPFVVVP